MKYIVAMVLAAVLFTCAFSQSNDTCTCTNYTAGNYTKDDLSGCKSGASEVCYGTTDDSCSCVDISDIIEALATAIIIAIVIGSLCCLGVLIAICCCICGGVACCCAAGAGAGAAAGSANNNNNNNNTQMSTV